MDFTMDFTLMILKALSGAAFDMNTYIGIAVGALLSRVWIAVYELAKSSIILKLPLAAVVIKRFEMAVRNLLNKVKPFADKVQEKADEKKEKLEK